MKRSNPSEKPALSWCLVVRNCASTLEACLKSLRERTPDAEIAILDTLSDDAGVDVKLDRKSVLAKVPAGVEPHGFLRRTLEDAGWKVVFIRIADEVAEFRAELVGLPPVDPLLDFALAPCVWIRVRPPERADPFQVERVCADGLLALLGAHAVRVRLGRSTQEIAREYADVFAEYDGPDHDWSREMPWVDDMASPRQAAMALATGRFIGWVDADDLVPGPQEAERLLKLNGRWHVGESDGAKGVEVKAADGGANPRLEEILTHVFDVLKVDQVECDYLYRADESGAAITWQSRERFVRNDDSHHWVSEGHEFLVARDASRPPKKALVPLLFVHRKEHTQEDQSFSVRRHFDVLSKKWARGERCGRDGLYLANFAMFLCPHEELRFLQEAREAAFTQHDRMRTAEALGNWHAVRGLYQDALEYFAAAQVAAPEYPDAFWALGEAATRAEDWPRATSAYRAVLDRRTGLNGSELPPRVQVLQARSRFCEAAWRIAEAQVRGGAHALAVSTLEEACRVAAQLSDFPGLLGKDAAEIECFQRLARQKLSAQKNAMALHEHWDRLVHLDETEKAMRVLDVVPHDLEDHPLVVAIERWARLLREHFRNREAYVAFYNSDKVNDAQPTPEDWLLSEGGCLPRTRATIAYLKERAKALPEGAFLDVVEFGPYDGISVIPILRAIPRARVVAVEAQERCAARLEERAKRLVPDGDARLTVLRGMFGVDNVGAMLCARDLPTDYDAVLLFEVIEHVPSVNSTLCALRSFCKPEGRVFLSTPWGAYDNGSPADMENRDPRGHVRALSLHDVVKAMRTHAHAFPSDLVPEHGENHVQPDAFGVGDTMYVRARRKRHRPDPGSPQPAGSDAAPHDKPAAVGFFVPSALWDWNATRLHTTGQGASESMIVFLAERLAADGIRADVYGPVPGEEVVNGVGYWQREKVRHLDEFRADAKLVVSRAPYAWRDILKGHLPGRKQADALWLQDAVYPGFEPEFLEHFRRIVCVSEWHKQAMHERHGMPLAQIDVCYNWVEPTAYLSEPAPARIPRKFVYASSPDRGLIAFLRMWPRILEKLPDAQLHIFYGWEGCVKLSASNPGWAGGYRKMREEYEKLKWQKGVFDRGRVNHAVLAHEMRTSDCWPYPSWHFEETCCANALQARAAGCVPVTVPVAALNETAACPQAKFVEDGPDRQERFVAALVEACETSESERKIMRDEVLRAFSPAVILPKWRRVLELP